MVMILPCGYKENTLILLDFWRNPELIHVGNYSL